MAFFQPSYVIGQSDCFQRKKRNRILIPLERGDIRKDYNKKVLRFPELKRDRKLHCRRKNFPILGTQKRKPCVTKEVRVWMAVIKDHYSPLLGSSDIISSESQFHCHKRASGYYADPRFKCEVFHYCHSDGTRVTIPCSKDNQKHRICFLKDIASKACDGTELFLPLPEDLFFKPSKDTTASAFNGATEFKLPEVLPEPEISSESNPSTTPLSSEDEKNHVAGVLPNVSDVGSIFEVFNSFLKEIETRQDLKGLSNSSSRPRPSTFSRRSRLPSSLEQKDALVDVSPSIERRTDEDGPFLVEVYNGDNKNFDGNDYSSYRRKSKKLFFTSDKKSPAKHPRKKRTIPDQQGVHRPYAIVYAKVPDTTMVGSLNGLSSGSQGRQNHIGMPFAPAIVPGNVPVVPVAIETRRKKKKKNPAAGESVSNSQTGQQQTSEQQNVYYYAPDQSNDQQINPNLRTMVDTRQQVRVNSDQGPNERSQNRRPQPESQPEVQNSRPESYSSPNANGLPIPTFPFQAPPFLTSPRQTPFFFGLEDGFQPFASPFGQIDPSQGRPQLGEPTPTRQQGRPQLGEQIPTRQQGPPQLGEQTSPRQQGHPQIGEQIPTRQQDQRQSVQDPPPPSSRQHSEGPPPSGSQIRRDPTGDRRPPNVGPQQGFPGFQNSYFDGFPGFGPSPFSNPFTQRDPSPFSLIPPGQIPQQSPVLPNGQPVPNRYNEQSRPQYSVQEIPRPQSPQNHIRTEDGRPAIPVPFRPEFSPYGRDRTRYQNGNVESPVVSQLQPPSRNNERPNSLQSPPHLPIRNEEIEQPPSRPMNGPIPGERGRPEQYSPYDPRLYQPEYSPEGLIVQPQRPPSVPVRNGNPREQEQGFTMPTTVLVEDYRQRGRPRPQIVENAPREMTNTQRQPTSERNRDVPERDRDSSRPPSHSSYYYSPTTPPPSSRIRQPTRTREETRTSTRGRDESRQPTRTREETRPPTRTREDTRQPTRTRGDTRPPTRTREETRPPTRTREQTRPPTRTREETRPPTRTREETRPPTRTRTRQPSRNERHHDRSRPVEGTDIRNTVEEIPDFGRTSISPDERRANIRTRPENIPDNGGYYRRPPPPRNSNEIPNPYSVPTPSTSRHRENTRDKPSQPQIERPPPDIPASDIYNGPQSYYPPQENYVNVISTVDNTEHRARTPPTVTVRRPSHRGSGSNVRDSSDHRNTNTDNMFVPMTHDPRTESYYRTRSPANENVEIIEEYLVPEKAQGNVYQDLGEIPPTTVQTSTTRRPTTKRRPPPPKPTFPTFPTFPPPPRRPVTSPRPRTESPETKKEVSDSYTSDPENHSPSSSRAQSEVLVDTQRLRSKEPVVESYTHISVPEVTTRRRTRKRKQKIKKPRPTVAYIGEEQTSNNIVTQPSTEKEVTTASTSTRSSRRWKQQTTQPRRVAATTPATEAAPLQREESVRVSKTPIVTRTRKPFSNRSRTRTSTTTTTENPETEEPVARSDESVDHFNYQLPDATTEMPSSSQYELHSTSSTQWPMELTTEVMSTTEFYNQMVETTPEATTDDFNERTDTSQHMSDDFESTRSVIKKFQNRPRILKFGKPKLKSTISPIELNAAESRIY
ncbi:uncharacterized protein CDAR_510791 [Caerostris darwini]|uniref:Chitin-binding type-2 domain-containing protein n=1 Tax=Caerostris darwini TaxID=1538125 RepID=A0AAV4TBP9_9ARAC|nr:uncharacterized protein CDAR_510791 [Caerostris darwini]